MQSIWMLFYLTVYYLLCKGLVLLCLDAAGATSEAYLDVGSTLVGIHSASDLELSGPIEAVCLVFKAKRGPVAPSFLWCWRSDCGFHLPPGRTEDHSGHLPSCVSMSVS